MRYGDDYDERFERLAAGGHDVHGEAALVASLAPTTVLDAGCGTGRVAIELSRRGVDVVGVDVDERMLATARRKRPDLAWHLADLAAVDLRRTFDVIVLAGNVMIFVQPGTEGTVVANLARHLASGGALVAGFQLQRDGLTLDAYDAHCDAAGLELQDRWATWDRRPWSPGDDYAVSLHRAATAPAP